MSKHASLFFAFIRGENDMAIRRIKAHYAIEDGDILKIINKPNRFAYFAFAVFFALIVVVLGASQLGVLLQVTIVLVAALIGFLSGSSGIEREVPRADLVEVKRYKWPPRVTVVLDDERAKMAKPPVHPPQRVDDE